MILKPYVSREERDKRRSAGHKAEQQMAHYLDRQFRTRKDVHVLHNVRFEYEGDVAQVDHLVVHRFGIAIVESKSVSASVRINAAGEWERQWEGRWQGMPDPVLQGERQGMLLKELLASRQAELLDKAVFGLLQGTFTAMALDVFVAISEKGTIQRATHGQAPSVTKADAVPKAIEELVTAYRRGTHSFDPERRSFTKVPRQFSEAELLRIGHFLRDEATNAPPEPQAAVVPPPPVGPVGPLAPAGDGPKRAHLVCKHCGSADVEAHVGSYGPYAKCRECDKNTSVPRSCDACGERVWLAPTLDGFEGTCACGRRVEVRFGAGGAA